MAEYHTQQQRRAHRQLECTGGTTWCTQVIAAGEWYTALLATNRCVGKWCAECSRVLGRW